MQIHWNFPRSKMGATLHFPTETSEDTLKELEKGFKSAGFDGHVVLHTCALNTENKVIFILRWNHFTWEQVQNALKKVLEEKCLNAEFVFANPKAS